jgi:hypothetical protein
MLDIPVSNISQKYDKIFASKKENFYCKIVHKQQNSRVIHSLLLYQKDNVTPPDYPYFLGLSEKEG